MDVIMILSMVIALAALALSIVSLVKGNNATDTFQYGPGAVGQARDAGLSNGSSYAAANLA